MILTRKLPSSFTACFCAGPVRDKVVILAQCRTVDILPCDFIALGHQLLDYYPNVYESDRERDSFVLASTTPATIM